jgi:hypothetical protein
MFCLRCGALLRIEAGHLECSATGCDLSGRVAADPVPPTPSTVNWGGQWYCPADGEKMSWQDGLPHCATCGRTLPGGLIYEAIEFHPPHRD